MGIIQELETLKYRFVLDLIKNDEPYDKDKKIINGKELFKLCHDRYLLLQEILLPIKKRLGNEIDITDIYFTNNFQDDNGIIVKYTRDDKQYFLAISNLGFEDISIVSSDIVVQNYGFVNANRRLILNTFKNIDTNLLDTEIKMNSTSNKFIAIDNCDSFVIKDVNEKVFSIEGKHSNYEKNNQLSTLDKRLSIYPKLKEMLLDDEKISLIYEHLHFYEIDFPNHLTKKLNNC